MTRTYPREGQNLGRGILKIDSFLNHQVDAELMEARAQEIARRFAARSLPVLTAEVSGIIPAVMTGKALRQYAGCLRSQA